MSTTMAIIPTSQCLFQTSTVALAPTSSFKRSGGATFPRQRSNSHGVVSMACVRAASGAESPHTLLGVEHGASKGEIKKAYRRLAKQYHPDVCRGNDCTTQFQLINSAYEALMNGMAMPTCPSMSDNDLERTFVDPNNNFLDEMDEWMGLECAGTYDFSTPIDN